MAMDTDDRGLALMHIGGADTVPVDLVPQRGQSFSERAGSRKCSSG